jgi:hypothetical protein
MNDEKYKNIWLALVDIRALDGFDFMELIDVTEAVDSREKYIGGIGNILVKADDIYSVLDIVKLGLKELNLKPVYIDKVENVVGLITDNALTEKVCEEIDWLLGSKFVFKISDKLFPYSEE